MAYSRSLVKFNSGCIVLAQHHLRAPLTHCTPFADEGGKKRRPTRYENRCLPMGALEDNLSISITGLPSFAHVSRWWLPAPSGSVASERQGGRMRGFSLQIW